MEMLKAGRKKPEAEQVVESPMAECSETENRIFNRLMDSKVFDGRVELLFILDKPDQAMVDGVQYTNDELKGLLSKKLNHDEIRNSHEVKKAFGGAVIPSDQVEEFKPISRW